MNFKVIKGNFSNANDWIFKMEGVDDKKIAFILDDPYYSALGIKTPLHKGWLDSIIEGRIVDVDIKEISSRNIVTAIHKVFPMSFEV